MLPFSCMGVQTPDKHPGSRVLLFPWSFGRQCCVRKPPRLIWISPWCWKSNFENIEDYAKRVWDFM